MGDAMIIYYAHPIDQQKPTARYATVSAALALSGHQLYDPGRAWRTEQLRGNIQPINLAVLDRCDVLVAHLPGDTPTIGTHLELQYAIDRKIPTVVYTDTPRGWSEAVESLQVPVARELGDLMGALRNIAQYSQIGRRSARWVPTGDGGKAPTGGKPGDAGFDLYVSSSSTIWVGPGEFSNIPSEIAVQLPPGMWCLIVGRSSTWTRGLMVTPAVIDAGYRGALYACVHNLSDRDVAVEGGDRIAQLIPMPLLADTIQWAESPLDDSDRGLSGFGSTGR